MAIPSDTNLRNRLISKQLDVGKRKSDTTSDSANDPSEAVESPINSFAQSPSSADRLRDYQGALDGLLGGGTPESISNDVASGSNTLSSLAVGAPAAVNAGSGQSVSVEELQSELLDRGYSPGSIDGSFGPKTLEALNLFQQDQVDALKIQTNNLANPAARTSLESTLQRLMRQSASGNAPTIESLSSLSNAQAKSVAKTDTAVLNSLNMQSNTLKNNDL